MAALLTIEAANTDKLAMYLGECRELGVTILPPDINSSQLAVHGRGRRRPLWFVRGQERRRRRDPVDARTCAASCGRIDSLYTLCEHVDLRLVNKRVLESLIKAGAFDSLLPAAAGRRRAAPGAALRRGRQGDRAWRPSPARSREGPVAAVRRRSDDGGRSRRPSPLPDAAPWTEMQQLAFEKEALGLYMSGHPLERFSEELKTFGAQRVGDLTSSHADVWVGGIVSGPAPAEDARRATGWPSSCSTTSPAGRGRGVSGDVQQVSAR